MTEITQTKKCNKCKTYKQLECFSKNKNAKDGYDYKCKKSAEIYYETNRAKILKKRHINYERNKEKNNQYSNDYYSSNKQVLLKKYKLYRAENKEKIAERRKTYRDLNKEIIAERKRNYYKTIKGKISRKNTSQKRRTIKNKGDVTNQQLLYLQENAKTCYWCGVSLNKTNIHIDHYVPLSCGGQHTLSNLVISCDKCNLSKGSKDPLEFANKLGKLL